jgi:hypothetical protein
MTDSSAFSPSAIALFEHLDRFAALLGHLLKHLAHRRVVIGGGGGGAQFDVAILDRRQDQAHRLGADAVARLHRVRLRGLDLIANHATASIVRGQGG